jgi:hypothetical protein
LIPPSWPPSPLPTRLRTGCGPEQHSESEHTQERFAFILNGTALDQQDA